MGGPWRVRGWAASALVALLLTAPACGGDDAAAPTAPTRPLPATTAFPTTPASAPAPPHLAAPDESPLATWATDHVEAWWADTLPALTGRAYQPVRGPVGAVGVVAERSACAPEDEPTAVAAYCPTDDSILWDGGLVTAIGAEHGRLGVGLLVAHEWAHVAQAQGLSWGDRDIEDQADCLAGAWARQATAADALGTDVDEAGVAAAGGALVDLAAETSGSAGTDGPQRDREARVASVVDGWRGGPEACAPVAAPPSGGDQP